jgi:hypothetical protein
LLPVVFADGYYHDMMLLVVSFSYEDVMNAKKDVKSCLECAFEKFAINNRVEGFHENKEEDFLTPCQEV